MESVFTRTYKYREREKKNNLENYLIEIFAFCLEVDELFKQSCLSKFGFKIDSYTKITTQYRHEKYGQPDIHIANQNSILLIECKIESKERENQLNNYHKILENSSHKYKHLIYLTKYYESKDLQSNGEIKYMNYSWWDIYNLISDKNGQITKELKKFLEDKNIAMDKDFKNIDLVSLKNITGTISKMDEVLDAVKEKLKNVFEKSPSRTKNITNYSYLDKIELNNFSVELGFMWWYEDNRIYLTTRLEIPEENNAIVKSFKPELAKLDWDYEELEDNVINIIKYMDVDDIVENNSGKIKEMIEFLKQNIDTIIKLKSKNEKIFR